MEKWVNMQKLIRRVKKLRSNEKIKGEKMIKLGRIFVKIWKNEEGSVEWTKKWCKNSRSRKHIRKGKSLFFFEKIVNKMKPKDEEKTSQKKREKDIKNVRIEVASAKICSYNWN